MMRSLVLIPLLILAAAQSCQWQEDFHFESREHHLRYSEDTDALRYVEVYSAIGATDPERAVGGLQSLLQRRRVYPPERGMIHIDLDEPWELDDIDESEASQLWLALMQRLLDCVEVQDVGLFLDGEGELCAWRQTRIQPTGPVLEAVDALVCASVLEGLSKAPEDAPFPSWLDPASLELARKRASEGGPWVRTANGRLGLDWPLSPAGAARVIERLADREKEPLLAPWFCSQIGSLTCADGRVLVILGRATDPGIHFRPPAREIRDGPDVELIEAVRQAGLELRGADAIEGVLADLRGE